MSEIVIPDTVLELQEIWDRGTAEIFDTNTNEEPERTGRFQMLQATKKGLVVVVEVPISASFPQNNNDPDVFVDCRFLITDKIRDDLYRVWGPGAWKRGVFIESESGPATYLSGDTVLFRLRLSVADLG